MQINATSSYSRNVSFRAITSAQLTTFRNSFRLMCEEKAPLEKMNTIDDMITWGHEVYDNFLKNFSNGRKIALENWENCIDGKLDEARGRDSVLWKYLILLNLSKVKSSFILAPKLDIIVQTITDIKDKIEHGLQVFNFYRYYVEHVKDNALNKYFPEGVERTGWVEVKAQENSEDHDKAIDDLCALSAGTNWCTQTQSFSSEALNYSNSAMYIYFNKGTPLHAVRTLGNYTQEIKDRHNNTEDLPEELWESLIKFNPDIKYSSNCKSMLD
ncbi:hypothetical protein J6R97_04615 [bacterium]|nr:hypothetical protein [bacterium]